MLPTKPAPIVLFVLLALASPCLGSDIVELKTGERIQGAFKQANTSEVVIEVVWQPVNIKFEDVRAIYFGVPPASGRDTKVPIRHEANPRAQEALETQYAP